MAAAVPEFTTVVAVDRQHLEELRIVWPTWRAFRPEIMAAPLHFYCDLDAGDTSSWRQALNFIDHPNKRIFGWAFDPAADQREKMLSSLVYGPPKTVETPYFLKIDTDCIAAGPGQWIEPWWFDSDPVFVSSPWGYSKPADTVQRLDDWGDTIEELKRFPRLDIPYDSASRLVRHRRIISYVYFGRADWHRQIADCAGERLPVPSQDGFCWYCAERSKAFYRTVKMSKFGWRHVGGNLNRLKAAAYESLAGVSSGAAVAGGAAGE